MSFGQFFLDNIFLFLMLFAAIGGIIYFELQGRNAAGEKVSNARAAVLANDNGAFSDLRSAQDFRQGHIAGAKNMPLAELHDHVGKIRTAKNRPLVIYDHDGMNTAAAAKTLRNGGFEAIYILEGGINGWLAENLPDAETITVSSNAEAAKLAAAEPDAAAIAGKMAGERYGVPLRYPHIEDDGNNTTRFLVIGKDTTEPSGRDKTTILVSSQNRPGLLYKLLEPIGRHGINMTRIESRPSKQGIWEYIFFIDLDGHQSDPKMQNLLAEIEGSASLFRVLGSYPQAVLK